MKTIKILCILLISTSALFSQRNLDNVEIKITPVNGNVYVLTGAGGNIGLLTGDDGLFMIDDQFAALSERIKEQLKTISDSPVKYLVNSHYHGDHTGGNVNFQKDGAMIFAHENVRNRLKNDTLPKEFNGLPIVTFDQNLGLHINENDIIVSHVHHAHTDGDALIYFPQSNVLHTGDTFFNGSFPYIDLESGGSVEGNIQAAKSGLALINENTKIIPGHGEIATYADYENYLKMLEGIRDKINMAIAAGKSLEEVVADTSLTADFYTDDEMKDSFINGPKIRTTFYNSLVKQIEE
ncbi:MBL fold metallo-hydrolase [Gramella sp. AN32]|uniref:MBL fold metallo-hydrolase n=1 Tax=Christiangramia antarctica TaxID=2058158 RepID=A0ABW5X6S0_9FLAO|nr:MBL fold metallo-hydrolase [Gramella sp. AN32]MCM4154651.1 MBL fold metallo-hydrolase [Gramella sp. AN32]